MRLPVLTRPLSCHAQPGVSKWATALRVALQQVEKKEAQQAADRATMEAVVHPT